MCDISLIFSFCADAIVIDLQSFFNGQEGRRRYKKVRMTMMHLCRRMSITTNTAGLTRITTNTTRTRVSPLTLAILLSSQISSLAFRPPSSARHHSLAFNLNMSMSASSKTKPIPPIAKREEDCAVLAGKLPPDNPDAAKLIRQSATSPHPLLDPARPIPDPYGWLRDSARKDPDILEHLTKENDYTKAMTSHLEPLRETLYDEMIASIQETDYTSPSCKDGKFWYYSRTNKGESYKIYCRAPFFSEDDVNFEWDGTIDAPIMKGEEQYLNVNEIAKDQSYCSVASATVSKSQNLLAYMVDLTGDEIYSLYVKNLETGEIIAEEKDIECSGSVVWGLDENTLFYLTLDNTQRPYQVYKRLLDGSGGDDELLFEQDDALFWTGMGRSSDDKYLLIETSSSETSEVHYLDLTNKDAKLECVAKKRTKVLYEVDHWNGFWVVTSNVDETPNMRLMVCEVGQDETNWEDVTDGEGVKLFDGGYERALDGVGAFEKYIVASGRYGGIPAVWVLKMVGEENADSFEVQKFSQLSFDEDAYDVGVGVNYNYNSERLALYYDSLTTPLQSLEVSMAEPDNMDVRRVLKAKNVPGYTKEDYDCQRITVTSRDGKTEIPVSFVYRRDVMEKHVKNGETLPLHLVGYGSYGACCEADFSSTRLTLLNRGIVCAVAHIRGGGEMGRQWYEEPNGGKYLCKENTFNDFVDIAKWFIDGKKLTTSEQLSIEGRSAGGLLIGATINQSPETFKVAILGVPFVDVAATMVDSSIPLTTNEWEEWGNPNEEKFFDYMLGYSPVNNVKKGVKYPSCLLTAGLHDPRVAYWEVSFKRKPIFCGNLSTILSDCYRCAERYFSVLGTACKARCGAKTCSR